MLTKSSESKPLTSTQLFPAVYHQLRVLAITQMASEAVDHTLQPTALVHEAYLRLADQDQQRNSRGHFFSAAAEAMRRILVDSARRRRAQKRGGSQRQVSLDQIDHPLDRGQSIDLIALDEALTQLAERDPQKATLVQLRYFAGFSVREAAELLGISEATATRNWVFARAWLYARLALPED